MVSALYRHRPALPTDVPAIAAIHVTCWEETYRGLLPDSMFAARTVAVREAQWAASFARDPRTEAVFVATAHGRVVGFASAGDRREEMIPAPGELQSLYIPRTFQGLGIGRALFRVCVDALRHQGRTGFGVRVLVGNDRAERFYIRQGGRVVAEPEEVVDGMIIRDRIHVWDLSAPSGP